MIDSLEALTKIGLYSGLLLFVGSCAAVWLVRGATAADAPPSPPSFWSIASTAMLIVLVFLFLRLVAHTWLTFGADGALLDNLRVIALRSRWSAGWQLQVGVAGMALPVVLWARRGAKGVALIATLLAIALAWSYTRLGHSAANPLTGAAATAHMLGAGVWLGTLAVLVLSRYEGGLWAQFSLLALTGAAVVGLSGLILASTYLSTWLDLFESAYGRAFLIKMACFAGILACGFRNWRQVQQSAYPDLRPATARLEVGLAFALVVVTAFLTEIAHP